MDERERQQRIDSSRAGRKAVTDGDPTGWFEPLYASAAAAEDPCSVPWVHLTPHDRLLAWLDEAIPEPGRALVIGCGLGDDAEELARRGFEVTAFDLSKTAVQWCRERFPDSSVVYETADLLAPPSHYRRGFDLVVEIYTVQALPLAMRNESTRAVSGLVADGGTLLVVAHGRSDEETNPKGPPWPLSPTEMQAFATEELVVESIAEVPRSDQDPPAFFLCGVYRKRAAE